MQQTAPSDQQLSQVATEALGRLKAIQNDPNWEKFSDKPCLMLKMQTESRVMSRGETKVNIPLHELYDKLNDEQSLKKINDQLKEIKTLHTLTVNGKQSRVIYMHYAGMWPVQDRDLVNCTTKEKGDDVCYIATQACNYPYPQPDKVTRATCYIGGWILKKIDAQNTYVIYISDVDLAGSIPGMIKNKLAEKQAGLASRVEKALKA